MTRIVVGVDGSAGARRALTWAAQESAIRGWPVIALVAWGWIDQFHAFGESFEPAYDQETAEAELRRHIDDVLGEERGDIEARAVCDLAPRALLDAVDADDLLVVGARGHGGFLGLRLGSVSEQCVRHAETPIAIVSEEANVDREPLRSVVVGVDSSDAALVALRWAAAEAAARGATLEVVHAWHPYPIGADPLGFTIDPHVYEDAGKRTLEVAVESVDSGGVAVVPHLVAGSAARVLVDMSHDADVVVVGSRGAGGFTELLLGSVAHQVAHHAGCVVVIVPARGG